MVRLHEHTLRYLLWTGSRPSHKLGKKVSWRTGWISRSLGRVGIGIGSLSWGVFFLFGSNYCCFFVHSQRLFAYNTQSRRDDVPSIAAVWSQQKKGGNNKNSIACFFLHEVDPHPDG